MQFSIQKEILERFPDVKIGVIVALGVKNTDSKEILSVLRKQEKETQENHWE